MEHMGMFLSSFVIVSEVCVFLRPPCPEFVATAGCHAVAALCLVRSLGGVVFSGLHVFFGVLANIDRLIGITL
jgi:hypothetical protein